jgi:hypothetical protein
MIATLDREKAMAYLEQVVQLKGFDYSDPFASSETEMCTYFDVDDKPLCIVGHVLAELNVEPNFENDEIQNVVQPIYVKDPSSPHEFEFEAPAEDYYNGGYIDRNRDVTLTSGAVTVLRAAQAAQDSGYTWGEALSKATEISEQFERDGYGV